MSTSPNAAARIQAQQRQMAGKDVVCEKCGSEHFYEVQVTRYLAGGSGSVEILADTTDQVFPLLRCAGCNFPILPKVTTNRRHGGVYELSQGAFRNSIVKGQTYLNSQDATDVKTEVLQAVAGKHVEGAVEDLRDRVNELEKIKGAAKHTAETKGLKKPTNEQVQDEPVSQ